MSTSRHALTPIPLWIGSTQYPGLQRRLLPGGERFRSPRAGPVVNAIETFGIVADHRIPECLTLHPNQACGLGPRQALDRIRDREQAHGSATVRFVPRQTTQLVGRQVLANSERRHGIPPASRSQDIISLRQMPLTNQNFREPVSVMFVSLLVPHRTMLE